MDSSSNNSSSAPFTAEQLQRIELKRQEAIKKKEEWVKKRIESNRQEALKRRAIWEKSNSAQNNNQDNAVTETSTIIIPQADKGKENVVVKVISSGESSNVNPVPVPVASSSSSSSSKRPSLSLEAPLMMTGSVYGNVTKFNDSLTNPDPPKNKKTKIVATAVKRIKSVIGTTTLITPSTFRVNMKYNASAVAVFKTMESAKYNPSSQLWEFALNQHAELLDQMKHLEPNVILKGLPKHILRIFGLKTQEEADLIHASYNVNLSCINSKIMTSLLPFQKKGIEFGIRKNGRVMIADDPLLGRMIQALGIAEFYNFDWPLIIITTMANKKNWQDGVKKWLPNISTTLIEIVASEKPDLPHDKQIFIMDYTFLQLHSKQLMPFKCMILDEAHVLRDYTSDLTQTAIRIMKNSNRVILLNQKIDYDFPFHFYPFFEGLNSEWIDQYDFMQRYKYGHTNELWKPEYNTTRKEELELLLCETFMIRRETWEVKSEQQVNNRTRQKIISDMLH